MEHWTNTSVRNLHHTIINFFELIRFGVGLIKAHAWELNHSTTSEMQQGFVMLLLKVALALCAARTGAAVAMTNSWAVEVRSGGKAAADALASKHGFINLGQVLFR